MLDDHRRDDGRAHCRGNCFRRYFQRRGGDIQQATNLARAMVCQWGMSDKLGMVQYGSDDEYVFLGREMMRARRITARDGAGN
jgi:ATP-dependent Zn protease